MNYDCIDNVCWRGKCCSQTCGPCQACNATGSCVPICSDPNGCVPLPAFGDCAGNITCSSLVAGWSGGGVNQCERYSHDTPRRCRQSKLANEPDLCTPANAVTFCRLQNVTRVPIVNSTCDSGCIDSSKCSSGALTYFADSIAEVKSHDRDR